ncbi:MAG: hypothetical protein KQH79_13795 [Bacteroidetes bacterium]|nr:hypothetical protein [Bacteroidota bacterium]
MKQKLFLSLFLICAMVINSFAQSKFNHHNLFVDLDIAASQINITDTITLSKQEADTFYLNPNLNIYESSCEVTKIESGKNYTKYKLIRSDKTNKVVLKYSGIIANNKEGIEHITHQTMFESTTGIIFEKGIYLSGETYWVADFTNANLKTFSIHVNIHNDWMLTSQGKIIAEQQTDSIKSYIFDMTQPTNQVCLIGNKWTKYTKTIDHVDINVYLINPDETLAAKYLNATSDYIRLYYNLIGEFPYPKFDVIENFWETGYGMPSFTLLGKRVMRFPWILNTSYPHELLHNYWGNSVYVDYEKGNWCEGITTYMADHLLKEKDGDGDVFRRSQLKKYTDYVHTENDFPVSEFTSKHDATSEAIGYSKVLMINHMLRIKYGTEVFLKAYADFYRTHQFKMSSFDDIQQSFEKITGDQLDVFFKQWVYSTGAPSITLEKVKVKKKKGAYNLRLDLSQSGTSNPFQLNIPVFIYLNNSKTVVRKVLNLNNRKQSYTLNFSEEPVRIDIDPMFDVMRRLNVQEVPPTLSQIMGSDQWTIILPKSSKDYFYYKNLAISWKRMYSERGINIEMVNDSKLNELPTNGSVWILGAENKFANRMNLRNTYNETLSAETLDKIDHTDKNELLVFTMYNPDNKSETIGYINGNKPSVLGRLNMKLMHYSNFSYFGFESDGFTNILKGSFPVLKSPLNYIINDKKTIDWSKFSFPKTDIMYK